MSFGVPYEVLTFFLIFKKKGEPVSAKPALSLSKRPRRVRARRREKDQIIFAARLRRGAKILLAEWIALILRQNGRTSFRSAASGTAPYPLPRSSLPKTNPRICFGEERQRRERAFPLAGEANDTELAATWRTRARNAAQAPLSKNVFRQARRAGFRETGSLWVRTFEYMRPGPRRRRRTGCGS